MTFLDGGSLESATGAVPLEGGNHSGKHNELRAALLELRDELLPDISTLTEGDLLQVDASGRLVRLDSGTYAEADAVIPKSGASLWIPAGAMAQETGGTATIGHVATYTPAWILEDGANQRPAVGLRLPSWMDDFHIDVHMSNNGAGSGDVFLWVNYQLVAAEGLLLGGTAETITWTAGSEDVPDIIRAHTNLGSGAAGGKFLTVRVWRKGFEALDTLTNSVALLGIEIVNAA